MNRDIGDGPFGPTRTGAGVEAPGRVELPTNGLGNWGFPLYSKRINELRVGFDARDWAIAG